MRGISPHRHHDPLYNVSKTLRSVQEIPDITPLRLFKVFYPLYSVSISGTHYHAEPFEFIEKYIESYLEASQTATVQELTNFFGLRLNMIEKILQVLLAIKHVSLEQDHYKLTQLGRESVALGKKRLGDDRWGQKLFFDAYFLEPLPRELSSESKTHVLSRYEAGAITSNLPRYDPCYCLANERAWVDSALEQLLNRKDREKFNLPDEITNLRHEANELVYIPMHIVAAVRHEAGKPSIPYYLAFTNASDARDRFFEKLINQSSAGHINYVQATLYAEDTPEQLNVIWEKWLVDTNVTGGELEQLPNGTWQVNVIARDIHSSNCKINARRIGSYWLDKGYFIKIWSKDVALRREAAFENTISSIRRINEELTIQIVKQHLDRNSRNLQTGILQLVDLQRYIQKKSEYTDIAQLLENID